MSKIPDTKKTKYNHSDPFRWVDSQWEKFMTEQKELKARIKELEGQLEDLVSRVPSKFLNSKKKYYDTVSEYVITKYTNGTHYDEDKRNGGERRWEGEDRRVHNRRHGDDGEQLNLFEPNDVY